jgi:hypothetical protein
MLCTLACLECYPLLLRLLAQDEVRDPGRRSVNEARLQLLLYLGRHRGITLPRGPEVAQLQQACMSNGRGGTVVDPHVAQVRLLHCASCNASPQLCIGA